MDWKQALAEYGYVAVTIGCFVEGETVLLLAAFAAELGYLTLPGVMVSAALGGFASDQSMYLAGRIFGPRLIAASARLTALQPVVRAHVDRHAIWLAFAIRFAVGLRTAGPLLIGASGVTPSRFATPNAVGAMVWATVYASFGYLSDSIATKFLGDAQLSLPVLLTGLGLIAGLALAIAIVRRRLLRRLPPRQGTQRERRFWARSCHNNFKKLRCNPKVSPHQEIQ